jgi:hypothetical protein
MGKEDLRLRFEFGVSESTFSMLWCRLDCLLIADTVRGIVQIRTHIREKLQEKSSQCLINKIFHFSCHTGK